MRAGALFAEPRAHLDLRAGMPRNLVLFSLQLSAEDSTGAFSQQGGGTRVVSGKWSSDDLL